MLIEKDAMRGGSRYDLPEGLREKRAQPQRLLHAVHCQNILTFSGGKGDNLLTLEGSGYSTIINEERIARDGMFDLSHAAVCICIALEGLLDLSIQKSKVLGASQTAKISLYCFPVCWTGV